MKLAMAAEMQNLDRAAIEGYGIPGIVLMENAGRGTVECMIADLGPPAGKLVPVFVGPGNNGGDGLVIARYIHQYGGIPYIITLVEPEGMKGDAAVNAAITAKIGLAGYTAADDDRLSAAGEVLVSTFCSPVASW